MIPTKLFNRLIIAFNSVILILIAGMVTFHYAEGWRWLDSLYYTSIVVTTVGLGDFVPQTDVGKVMTMLFAFTGIGIVLYALSQIGSIYYQYQETHHLPRLVKRRKSR